MPKVTEEELVGRIQSEITDSLGYGDELSKQRETAMEYYYGLPFGNEVDGRSQFVDSTVQDTIEWIKPSLMRVFASGDDMVKFNPVGPEDVEMAKQATDYVNYVFTKLNNGWEILYNWFTDALLSKNGIVKVWWNEEEVWNREEYKGLTEIELDALINEEDVEVIAHSPYISSDADEMTGEYTSTTYHDVVIKRLNSKGSIKVENVPPSEFLINREAKTIQDARFVCHRLRKTLSELREMGYDPDPAELGSGEDVLYNAERQARYAFDLSSNADVGNWGVGGTEESLREYWLHENYVKTDYDGDGIAELRKVCTIGSTVLANDPIDSIPFVSICPIRIPHKFFGLSVADQVESLQLIKSTLMRNLMDNMYNQNFGRCPRRTGQLRRPLDTKAGRGS